MSFSYSLQSLDSLVASEEGRSKRHSASELSDPELSDVHREGWLLYKQILTNKGKVWRVELVEWSCMFRVTSCFIFDSLLCFFFSLI